MQDPQAMSSSFSSLGSTKSDDLTNLVTIILLYFASPAPKSLYLVLVYKGMMKVSCGFSMQSLLSFQCMGNFSEFLWSLP